VKGNIAIKNLKTAEGASWYCKMCSYDAVPEVHVDCDKFRPATKRYYYSDSCKEV